jgi:hypothetical protein
MQKRAHSLQLAAVFFNLEEGGRSIPIDLSTRWETLQDSKSIEREAPP